MMVSIIIPVWNKWEFTGQCIAALNAFTPEEHEILFIDNGSTDGTHENLKELCSVNPSYTLIRNETNLGFPIAVNQGIQMSKGEYICVLNNDVLVTKEWLKGLMDCMKSRPETGIVGPRTNNISGCQQLDEGKYQTPEEMLKFAEDFRKSYKGFSWSMWRIPFFCTLIKKEVFDKIGLLDEQFSPGNFEDDDFCLRALNAGYKGYVAGDVFVHHFGSASQTSTMQKIILTKNKKLFIKKHLKTSISCCMIIKNEEKNIERCLESALPLFDEIVIVDTGSTDRTLDIITGHPSEKIKLFEYQWDNDFSKARNYSLSKATKDWIFILDADEVITDLDRDSLYPMTAYRYETRNYTNVALYTGNKSCVGEFGKYEKGEYWHPSFKIRMFPNHMGINFQYPVHEVVEESVYQIGLFISVSMIPVHHYGSLDDEKLSHKDVEYKQLLKKIITESPNDIRNLEQLAISNQKTKQWDDAIGIWDNIISMDGGNIKAWHNKGHCIVQKTGDFNEAIKCFKRAMEIDNKDRDAVYNYGYSLYKLGNTSEAEQIADNLCQDYPDFIMGKFLKQLINDTEDIANVN